MPLPANQKTITAINLPETMRALKLQQAEETSAYSLLAEAVAVPAIAADEVLIRVCYAGINRADQLQALGRYPLPKGVTDRLGLEVSGHIAAIGSDVNALKIGDPVAALTEGGGYAEYVSVPASYVLPKIENLSLEDMAAVPEAAAAGWLALMEKGALKQHETVLIQGASGNIGLFMVQLALAFGAKKVLATAGADKKCQMLENIGATALHYKQDGFDLHDAVMQTTNDKGVDIIIDPLGAGYAAAHLNLLRFGGRLVTIGFMAGAKAAELPLSRLLTRNLSWHGFTLRSQPKETKAQIMQQLREKVMPKLESGTIKPVIDSVVPFDLADKAHEKLEQGLHCGKILLEVHTEE